MTTDENQETQQVAVRLPIPLLKRLEEHAARIKRKNPGRLSVTRADTIRALLEEALDAAEARAPKKIPNS